MKQYNKGEGHATYESVPHLLKCLYEHYFPTEMHTSSHGSVCKGLHYKKFKKFAYTKLLSHHKDPSPLSKKNVVCSDVNEMEKLLWHATVLRQQCKYDDSNKLKKCLNQLYSQGHMEEGSDMRAVLALLIALKGFGEDSRERTLSGMEPRLIVPEKDELNDLPCHPLGFKESLLHSALDRWHYTEYDPSLFDVQLSEKLLDGKNRCGSWVPGGLCATGDMPGHGGYFSCFRTALSSCSTRPQKRWQSSNADADSLAVKLWVPELPKDPRKCGNLRHHSLWPNPSTEDSAENRNKVLDDSDDEGYFSLKDAPGLPPSDPTIFWEEVLQGLPFPTRRSWDSPGRAINKPRPFLANAGRDGTHKIWYIYQNLWSFLQSEQSLCNSSLQTISENQLCSDIVNILLGIPSTTFIWNEEQEKFLVREGVCIQTCTPGCTADFLQDFAATGKIVKRLDAFATLCTTSDSVTRHGLVLRAFAYSLRKFLLFYRKQVVSVGTSGKLLFLKGKTEKLMQKVSFVAELCHMNGRSSHPVRGEAAFLLHFPKGLSLIGELQRKLMKIQDESQLYIILYFLEDTCQPFFKYLENWVYEGRSIDPGSEFLVHVDPAAVLYRDRRYWTTGHSLKDMDSHSVPLFLRVILKQAFACGKALNLLRICKPKHHLLAEEKRPQMHLSYCADEVEQAKWQCEHYVASMEHKAAEVQMTIRQYEAWKEEEELKTLEMAAKTRAESLRAVLAKRCDLYSDEYRRKEAEFLQRKLEVEAAQRKKQLEKEKELEENRRIEEEMEQKLKEQKSREEVFRQQLQMKYRHILDAAEKRKTLAEWKLRRYALSKSRRRFLESFVWTADCNTHTGTHKIETLDHSLQCEGVLDSVKSGFGLEANANKDGAVSPMSISSDVVLSPCEEGFPDRNTAAPVLSETTVLQKIVKVEKVTKVKSHLGTALPSLEEVEEDHMSLSAVPVNQIVVASAVCLPDTSHGQQLPSVCVNMARPASVHPLAVKEKVLIEEYGVDLCCTKDANANISEYQLTESHDGRTENSVDYRCVVSQNNLTNGSPQAVVRDENLNKVSRSTLGLHTLTTEFPIPGCLNGNKNVNHILNPVTAVQLDEEGNYVKKNTMLVGKLQKCEIKRKVMEEEVGNPVHQMCNKNPSEETGCIRILGNSTVVQEAVARKDLKNRSAFKSSIFTRLDNADACLADQGSSQAPSMTDGSYFIDEDLLWSRNLSVTIPVEEYHLCGVELQALTPNHPWVSQSGTHSYSNVKLPEQLMTLPLYLMRSVSVQLDVQAKLVNEALLSYLLVEEKILDHFEALRSLLLLHDASFARALMMSLLEEFNSNMNPSAILNPAKLNSVTDEAISESSYAKSSHGRCVSVVVLSIPPMFTQLTGLLDCIQLHYHVEWPHCLLIDEEVLSQYGKIGQFCLSLHHVLWCVDDVFRHLSSLGRGPQGEALIRSPQFRTVSLYRHTIHVTIRVIYAYVTNQVLEVAWASFDSRLRRAGTLDELYDIHNEFLRTVQNWAFLTPKSEVVHAIIKSLFYNALAFRDQLLASPWKSVSGGTALEHPNFDLLSSTHQDFCEMKDYLSKLLRKVATWSQYEQLQDLVIRLTFSEMDDGENWF